jgi:hypothetical protein
MQKNGYLVYLKDRERFLPQNKNNHEHVNLSTEDLCPNTSLILAAGVEEEDVEQEDMADTVGSLSLP